MMSGREVEAAFEPASSTALWCDDVRRPVPRPALGGDHDVDLAVVGGGFTGLWAAMLALEEDPGRDVVVLEGARLGWAATGRNGGFCSSSLTHGVGNGPGPVATGDAAAAAPGRGQSRRDRGNHRQSRHPL